MKTLSLLTTVTLLTCFVSGCDSPKADSGPNSRKAGEAPPLVGPDVEIWKLTLNVRATGGYAWIDVRSDDKDMRTLDRSTGSEDVVSFEGAWGSGMWTEDYPSSYMVFWRLHLAPDGGAEHVNEEGHEEFQADSQEKVIYVRDRIIRHLVGKWRQTSDTTATVWLKPAPLVGPDVEVWELTLHVDTEQGYAWVDVVGNAPTTLRGPLDGHDDQASFEGTWEDRGGTEDIPSSFMESYCLLLMPDGQAEYLQEEGHGEFDEQSETKTKYVKDKIVRHLEGKWRQTSDTTATVWLKPAAAP